MDKLAGLSPEKVFKYFEEMSAVPRGSGFMDKIAGYCENFAKEQGLRYLRDDANNVVIFKDPSPGYENAAPVILQGHLDIVWQKDEDCAIDFENDGLNIDCDGEYVFAKGTTLGADNGIAVAMIMAILESDTMAHPALEAVFTTDEEVGMIGANALDTKVLSGKKMINLDSEDPGVLTVSCAGGSDFTMEIPVSREAMSGKSVTLRLGGLMGGHSGIEINAGRVNANILAGRVLYHIRKTCDFEIVSVCGGTKANAITNAFEAQLVTKDEKALSDALGEYLESIRKEICDREPGFFFDVTLGEEGTYQVIDAPVAEKIAPMLLLSPNGVCEMSASIENLVETSLNLGILKTDDSSIRVQYALRSNKASALFALEEKMTAFAESVPCRTKIGGRYMPWEFMADSPLQKLCIDTYRELYGTEPCVAAIHAGLECATFSANIEGLDCIAIGPEILDAHTTKERLNIASVKKIFDLVVKILEKCN